MKKTQAFLIVTTLSTFSFVALAGGGETPPIGPVDNTPSNCEGLKSKEFRHAYQKFVSAEVTAEGMLVRYPVYVVSEKTFEQEKTVERYRIERVEVPYTEYIREPIWGSVMVPVCMVGHDPWCRPIYRYEPRPVIVDYQERRVTRWRMGEKEVPYEDTEIVEKTQRVCQVQKKLREAVLAGVFTEEGLLKTFEDTPEEDLDYDHEASEMDTPKNLYPKSSSRSKSHKSR